MKMAVTFTQEQESCIETLASVFGGHHHLPRVYPWGCGVCINHYGDLSTFDFNHLTCLVLAAHRDAVRIEIAASGPRMVRIIAHKRVSGKRGELSSTQRHPDLDELIEMAKAMQPKEYTLLPVGCYLQEGDEVYWKGAWRPVFLTRSGRSSASMVPCYGIQYRRVYRRREGN